MTDVKSLSVTADTYRHRGWMWKDRGTYELFKPHMKLPLWIDRILTNREGTDLYAVGKTDGFKTVLLNDGCHWQLAGVRKKTVRVPAPEAVKPAPPDVPLMVAPYGTDIYSKIAQALDISRNAVKARLFNDLYNAPVTLPLLNLDLSAIEATAVALYGSLTPKPPIGVKPRNLHDEERANALDEAMVRYLNEDLPFPIEWAIEWNELRARLNKEQK